ncbi:MAG: PEP-CTERM sorting domain-containing protein [Phycisphaerae bacterium]
MKRLLTGSLVGLLSTAAIAGTSSGLLWDNYLSGLPGNDGRTGLSSERSTLVQQSWVVEDMILSDLVRIDEVRWIAYRETSSNINYPAADLLIMDENFNPVVQLSDLTYATTELGTAFGLNMYEGSIILNSGNPTLGDDGFLNPGRYFIGTRLVGNNLGQNFVATTGDGALNGQSYAFYQSESFAVNEWRSVNNEQAIGDSEFSYRVYGTVIPEPASMILLSAGALMLVRRSR